MIIRLSTLLIALACVISTGTLRAQVSPKRLETLVIQEGGRKKPYLVFSEETLRSLSGKTSLTLDGIKQDAMTVITGLWMNPNDSWKGKQLILVSNLPLRQHLGLDPSRKLYSYEELTGNPELAREIALAAETKRRDPKAKLSGLPKEASDVGLRLELFEGLIEGSEFRILMPISGNDWLSINQVDPSQSAELVSTKERISSSWKQKNQQGFNEAVTQLLQLQEQVGDCLPPGKSPSRWRIKKPIPSAGPGFSMPWPESFCFFPGTAGKNWVIAWPGSLPAAGSSFRREDCSRGY